MSRKVGHASVVRTQRVKRPSLHRVSIARGIELRLTAHEYEGVDHDQRHQLGLISPHTPGADGNENAARPGVFSAE